MKVRFIARATISSFAPVDLARRKPGLELVDARYRNLSRVDGVLIRRIIRIVICQSLVVDPGVILHMAFVSSYTLLDSTSRAQTAGKRLINRLSFAAKRVFTI